MTDNACNKQVFLLLGTTASPYVRKVRIVLAELGLDVDFQLADLFTPASKVLEHNPLGKVPCLVLGNGESIYDSRVIAEHLDALVPEGGLIPKALPERTKVKTWEALGDGVTDAALAVRMESAWPGRGDARSQVWMDLQTSKVMSGLAAMERQLAEREWCHGDALSLADISVGCALGYIDFRLSDIAWRAGHPRLAASFDKLSARPSFRSTQPS